MRIITHYTREAGLRNLEREVGSVCRKVAKDVVMHNLKKKVITGKVVEELLGPAKYLRDEELEQTRIGVTNGLAWTAVGGEVLFIEAVKMKGTGKLTLTGQMGDVMKESATAAMSYARANAKELGIDLKIFDEYDFHVHIPEGATPKDGPSAGITMATSLVSLLTDTPVRSDVAMTGEVTITGRVLPIGGLREKALAALRLGVSDVIIPFMNVKDLKDIPDDFRKQLNFIPVKHITDVLAIALDTKKKKNPSAKSGSGGHKKEKIASPAA
jgi:ATP-dependent Lon protease